MLVKIEGKIKNRQSRDTGNIKNKEKTPTMFIPLRSLVGFQGTLDAFHFIKHIYNTDMHDNTITASNRYSVWTILEFEARPM
jgi:hypothetical protein